jgi:Secretion system C-terminal sorting domain
VKRIFVFFILIFPLLCTAQKQGNIWYFGTNAGLDFNSGSPVPLTNGQTYWDGSGCLNEGSAVISDSSGSLLFYTNSQTIWNKNQQIMPNGDSLLGNFSSTQAALIVPQPGSNRYFYVFTTDDFCNDKLKYGFRYSIVDICADSGLGDVIPEYKNTKLLDTVCEKLTAVRHANGTDYWIIVHKYYSDAFYSYHLSSVGIIDTVISYVGLSHPDTIADTSMYPAIGQMKASPNGQKLAIVNANSHKAIVEYFDFDKSAGIVSNEVDLQTKIDIQNEYEYYGISFSPDNSKLYISYWTNGFGAGIFQFNLNAGGGNADSVIASRINIANKPHSYYGLQLAADGKIYVIIKAVSNYISVINFPNNLGLSCNYIDSAIYLNGKIANGGLPNFIDSYDYSNTIADCVIDGINEATINNKVSYAYPNPNNGSAKIDYTLPEGVNEGEIVFYNLMGNEVKRFKVNRTFNTLLISTKDIAAGTYYYQLQTTIDNSGGKKMVVIK